MKSVSILRNYSKSNKNLKKIEETQTNIINIKAEISGKKQKNHIKDK